MTKKKEASELAQLQGLLRQANFHTDVQEYILEMFGITSVADFYGIVKAGAELSLQACPSCFTGAARNLLFRR